MPLLSKHLAQGSVCRPKAHRCAIFVTFANVLCVPQSVCVTSTQNNSCYCTHLFPCKLFVANQVVWPFALSCGCDSAEHQQYQVVSRLVFSWTPTSWSGSEKKTNPHAFINPLNFPWSNFTVKHTYSSTCLCILIVASVYDDCTELDIQAHNATTALYV